MTVIDAEMLLRLQRGRRAICDFTVRPIAPSDADALVRFHEQLSDQTIRLRYFNLHRNLAPDEVAHLTCVDGFNRVAYVVEHEGEIVAWAAMTGATSRAGPRWPSWWPTSSSTTDWARCSWSDWSRPQSRQHRGVLCLGPG